MTGQSLQQYSPGAYHDIASKCNCFLVVLQACRTNCRACVFECYIVWILKSIAHAWEAEPPNIRKAASRIYKAYVCAACRFS